MLKYNKYIFFRIAWPMAIITFSLTGIAWLTQSLKFIDLIVNRGLDIKTFFFLSSLILPSLLWVIIPISLFISTIIAYNKLVIDSEFVVLKSAGIDRFGLIKPALLFACVITIISYTVSLYLLPASYREFKDMQLFIRNNYASLLLQEGVFSSPTEGLTVYIKERGEDGKLKGMLVHDTRNKDKSITMMAEEGELIHVDTNPQFLLTNGNRQEIDPNTKELSLLYFERYALDLDFFIKNKSQKRWREPQERYLKELFYPTDTADNLLQKLNAEGHLRIIWPLYNILLTLLALSPFIVAEFNRRGHSKKIVCSIVIATSVVIWNFIINNIVATNSSFTTLAYASIIGGIFLMSYVLLEVRFQFSLIKRFFRKQITTGSTAHLI